MRLLLFCFAVGGIIVGVVYENGPRMALAYVSLFGGVAISATFIRAAYLIWRGDLQ